MEADSLHPEQWWEKTRGRKAGGGRQEKYEKIHSSAATTLKTSAIPQNVGSCIHLDCSLFMLLAPAKVL